jgi:hypothetical protein
MWTKKEPIKGVSSAAALDLKSTLFELQSTVVVGDEGASSSNNSNRRREGSSIDTLELRNIGVSKRAKADEDAEVRWCVCEASSVIALNTCTLWCVERVVGGSAGEVGREIESLQLVDEGCIL